MKIFQIESGYCYWDATPKFGSLASLEGRFPPSLLFVEAPNYVFEGWGYDETKEGDERFIQPEAPSGFLYDPATGTFYPEDMDTPPTTVEDRVASLEARNAELTEALERLLSGETEPALAFLKKIRIQGGV